MIKSVRRRIHLSSLIEKIWVSCIIYSSTLLFPAHLQGQSHYELISNYSREAYRGGTQNWDIFMDGAGVLYFGNNKGVLSFNGQTWSLQYLPNKTIVRSISPRKEGGFYVGGQNEFGYFQSTPIHSGNYISLSEKVPAAYFDFEDVWNIFETDEGVYFCTEKAIFLLRNDRYVIIEPKGRRFENFFLYKGKLLTQELGEGLFVYEAGELKSFSDHPAVMSERVVSVIENFNGKELLIFRSGDFFHMGDDGLQPFKCEASLFTSINKAYVARKLENGRLLIGTTQNGAFMADSLGRILSHWNKDKGISNNTILSLFEDDRGNAWLGMDNGLSYIELNSPFTTIDRFNGVEGTGYAAFRKNGTTYLGTNQGLYANSDSSKPFKLIEETKGQVWSISELNTGFVLNAHDGAMYYNGEKWIPVSEVKGSWKILDVSSRKNFALQGAYGGFYLYEKTGNTDQPLRLLGKMEGFDESARIFEEDRNGYIWISHAYLGLYRLKPDYDRLRFSEIRRYDSRDGLPQDLYISVASVRNEMVFATPKGVYCLEEGGDSLVPHKTFTEVLGEGKNVQRIIEDARGNVWFSTEEEFGLIQVMPQGLFNKVDVLYFNQIQDRLVDGFENVFALDGNDAYIPLEDGFYRFDAGAIKPEKFLHPLNIEEVYLTSGNDSIIYRRGGSTGKIELKTDQKNLRFHYVLPAYGKLNQIKYTYKLEGFESNWSSPTVDLVKEYQNLDPGTYTFMVKATNAYGEESEPSTLSFKILPPWYATYTAKALFALCFILILGALIRYIVNRESRKTEAVKKKSIETIIQKEQEFKQEQEKSENEIIRLRNEKLRAEVNHKNAELASTTMHLVQKSEILQKIRSDLEEVGKESSDKVKERIRRIARTISDDVRLDKNWERFEAHFDQVHENFFKTLRAKYPELTPKDQKLCAYLRMNLATKEIAPLLNISVRGVEISRYRLRKKLGLDSDTNLVSFIMEI